MVKSVGQKNISKTDKRKWKIVSSLIILCFVAIISFLVWFFYVGSTKEIVGVADQFKPDSSWELITDDIRPPKTFCGDVECPSVYRGWSTGNVISKDILINRLKQSGWNFPVNGDCLLKPNIFGTGVTICSASGHINGYLVTVSISGSNTLGSARVGLNVNEE